MPDAPRPFRAPVWMSFIVVIMAAFLCITTVVLDPRLEYLYATLFIVAGVFLYIPFVHYSWVVPGMNAVTRLIQSLFLVVPPEDLEEDVLIGSAAKAKAKHT
ncbi:unnamed protein product [Allacma fusca]|uniref:Uncharacterized protein n=1 Tax=Allacma fusca TaxID=39272 RepID=A0A8J2LJY2_9HEXA|nr:unnamed protein product [Allacma fusca]